MATGDRLRDSRVNEQDRAAYDAAGRPRFERRAPSLAPRSLAHAKTGSTSRGTVSRSHAYDPGTMPLFAAGTTVFVPDSALPVASAPRPFALVKRTVERIEDRSIVVRESDGTETKIGSSRVHSANLGLLIVRIGNLEGEMTLLNPLAASVLQFFRLLLDDDQIARIDVRTPDELYTWWATNHAAYTHVVLVAHGGDLGLSFLGAGQTGQEFAQRIEQSEAGTGTPKHFVSLACKTGRAAFAKTFSESNVCSRLVAPYQSIHGAAASHFAQTYFSSLLLEGHIPKTAFNHAAAADGSKTHFRLWINGDIEAGRKT